ncbi:MAG: hypothetical protein ACLFPQ_01100 [Candidatus Woesearchaeota archaeon]
MSQKQDKINHEAIKKDAKRIMDNFMKELDKIPEIKEFGTKREISVREPKESSFEDDFRENILNNAPKTKDNCILAEKKHW